MRITAFAVLLILLSCGQKKNNQPATGPDAVTRNPADTVQPVNPAPASATPAALAVNQRLQRWYGDSLAVITDTDAAWMKDVFDYFIAPKRKTDPDYPYIALGDFNGDKQADTAALVKTKAKAEYQIAVISGGGMDSNAIRFWKEDIDICAVSTYPKGDLQGIDQPKVKMKGDGINVEYYEKASFVLYWDGKKFRRAQTGD